MPNPRYEKLVKTIGKAGMHALFPNDFEFYMIILELVDSEGATVDFLSFPVSPEKIMYENIKLTNIKKSMGGVSVLGTETFVPKNISMSGTFGRKLKLLLSKPTTSEENAARSIDAGVFENAKQSGLQIKSQVFNPKLKTGYGAFKLLEGIVDKSSGLDLNNEPFKLFLYNPTLNHSFLVAVNKLVATQDYGSSNMMWKYDLSLTAIAPVTNLRDSSKEEISDITEIDRMNKKGDIASASVDAIKSGLGQIAGKSLIKTAAGFNISI